MLRGTMNFLVSWINWGLPVLVYIYTAQISRAAPPHEREHKPTEVVMFSKVYERSICQVREILVDIYQEYPDEVEYMYKPSCVPLMRCAGCCFDETMECVPTDFNNVTMQIARLKPHVSTVYVHKSFQQHSHCECRLKKEIRSKEEKKAKRGKGLKRKRKKIRPCEPCTDTERRKHLFVQDPQTCKCSCKNTDSRCKTRQLELNEKTCRCEKPRR